MALPIEIPRRNGFTFPLRDGTHVFLGPIGPEDRQRLREGVRQLSPRSRYLRFFSGMSDMTEDQLTYFTDVDQVQHVAWGALQLSSGWPGLGLARFKRQPNDPTTAEMAVAVIDAYQGRGIGTILLASLCLSAEARGVRELSALVLPENDAVIKWFCDLGASVRFGIDSCEVSLAVPTDPLLLAQSDRGRRFVCVLDELRPRVTQRDAGRF